MLGCRNKWLHKFFNSVLPHRFQQQLFFELPIPFLHHHASPSSKSDEGWDVLQEWIQVMQLQACSTRKPVILQPMDRRGPHQSSHDFAGA